MLPAALLYANPQTVVELRADNHEIRESARVAIRAESFRDVDENGVLQIVGDDVVIDLGGALLRGAAVGASPDAFRGIGIRITGKNVTLKRARISGYKCGIFAAHADGLTLEDCDVSGNFAQHLRSTPTEEDASDWLWPHRNDRNEWLSQYGAGIWIEDSKGVTVKDCRARRTQNGLILDRVIEGRISDNDFSFLSGWGLAMWRCERNLISRNAFDFCVRGYSHGVYNRGQDSAGILFFEQNLDNVIVENSATHGGDGFFGFGGREAIGEDWLESQKAEFRKNQGRDAGEGDIDIPPDLANRYRHRGNRGNRIVANDFSYAAAHGIELTFSFGNQICGNRLVENAICGLWGGYSQSTLLCRNTIERNGDAGYGLERGGINIEHGRANTILANEFKDNAVGVHLWWDEDKGLLALPWTRANGAAAADNRILHNTFDGDRIAVELRRCERTALTGNHMKGVGKEVEATPGSEPDTAFDASKVGMFCPTEAGAVGRTRPVGARAALRGRDKIIITEWGPYDWQSPYLQLLDSAAAAHTYRLLGEEPLVEAVVVGDGVRLEVDKDARPAMVRLRTDVKSAAKTYVLKAKTQSQAIEARGLLIAADWRVTVFPWSRDPREDPDAWRAEAAQGRSFTIETLSLRYGNSGPSELPQVPQPLKDARLPHDHFGTLATTELTLPRGDWRIVCESDDGVRVWMNDKLLIDDWTWHAPKSESAEFSLAEDGQVVFRVEHFELDGFATLSLRLEAR